MSIVDKLLAINWTGREKVDLRKINKVMKEIKDSFADEDELKETMMDYEFEITEDPRFRDIKEIYIREIPYELLESNLLTTDNFREVEEWVLRNAMKKLAGIPYDSFPHLPDISMTEAEGSPQSGEGRRQLVRF